MGERLAKRDLYNEALRELRGGKKAEDLGILGIGLRPVRDRTPRPAPAGP